MLACVIGIPAVAMSGALWSEILKKLQDFRWPTIMNPAAASTPAPADEAQRFASSSPSAAPAAGRGPTGFLQSTSTRGFSPAPLAAPAQSGVVPAGFQMPADSRPNGALAATFPSESGTGAAQFSTEPFRSIQDRLREMGATYYLLESWGNQQQMYRFYCKMAVGGNPNYTHYFEDVESDPLQAMRQVLRQVENWHKGGL